MTDRYLVTGAAGFIGRPLCRRLQQDGRVRALLHRPGSGPWEQSLVCTLGYACVPDAAFSGVDTVFHLAGIVHARPAAGVDVQAYHAVNVAASTQLAEQAAAAGVRCFVYFSSVKAVADPGDRCVDESWQQPAHDPYGRSKHMAEQRLLAIGGETGMQVTILRPVLVYGPSVKGNLHRMLQAIDRGRFPPLPDTCNRRSMVSLDDLVEAAMLVSRSSQAGGQIYIVSDEAHYSTRQLYEWMCEALGKRPVAWSIPGHLLVAAAAAGDFVERISGRQMPVNTALLDRLLGSACYLSGRIRARLGWVSQADFRTSLPAMVTAYRKDQQQ